MATDATRSVVPQLARVYLAPVGSLAPTGATTTLDAAWREVGHTTPDSLNWATDPNFEEGRSHQSNYPIRRWQTTDAATAEADLIEWSLTNFRAVYGGGSVSTVTGPPVSYLFHPPSVGGRSETACIIELTDGSKVYRRIIPRCQQIEGVSQSLNKTEMSVLPLRLAILGSDVGDAWYDLSNDASFAPGAITIGTLTPATAANGTTTSSVIAGTGFAPGLTLSVSGTGVTATLTTYTSPTSITVAFVAASGATASARDVTITNPDGGTATKTGGWTVS